MVDIPTDEVSQMLGILLAKISDNVTIYVMNQDLLRIVLRRPLFITFGKCSEACRSSFVSIPSPLRWNLLKNFPAKSKMSLMMTDITIMRTAK